MKRAELRRKTPLVAKTPLTSKQPTLTRIRRLRPVSSKQQARLAVYRARRAWFLAAHPWCQFPLGCGKPATEVQHRRGRFGDRLNDESYWAASCHEHNMWAEEHTGEALACGWLVRIEGAA